MLRVAVVVVTILGITEASAAPCNDGPACERACAKDIAACTKGAELYFEGTNGHALDHTKSFKLSKRACDGGDGHACALLGLHYQDGLGTEYAPALALRVYDKACKAKVGVGCFNLASMYAGGHGVVVDTERADALQTKAREYWVASCNTDGDERRWCTNAAFLEPDGPKKAENRLALNLRACASGFQIGCVQALSDKLDTKAITAEQYIAEMTKLCDGGEASACGNLGSAFVAGDGVPADAKRGLGFLERACDKGDKQACLVLAGESASGKRLPQNLTVADRAFRRACDRASGLACLIIADVFFQRREGAVGAAFAKRACQMGERDGCDMLSVVYDKGIGRVAKNPREMIKWTTAACQKASGAACRELIKRGIALPVPKHIEGKLYADACKDGIAAACKRVKK